MVIEAGTELCSIEQITICIKSGKSDGICVAGLAGIVCCLRAGDSQHVWGDAHGALELVHAVLNLRTRVLC